MDRLVGTELGPTEWHTVTQSDINAFADTTGDTQWIHVDVERASAESPFGGTVAHGFLTLSLISRFLFEVDLFPTSAKQIINYGIDRARFITPVRAGTRVRARIEVLNVQDRPDGSKLVKCQATIEVENADRPALVAEVLNLLVPHAAGKATL
ncbi:MAG: MaoC family dehydratase [Chloroflexi bacterium]|nr:MaoC family dehydratase [Chloroflexota bacterium]